MRTKDLCQSCATALKCLEDGFCAKILDDTVKADIPSSSEQRPDIIDQMYDKEHPSKEKHSEGPTPRTDEEEYDSFEDAPSGGRKVVRSDFARQLERELAIANLKNASSLANNLCPDHRDKQAGKSCLACEIERLEKSAQSAMPRSERSKIIEEAAVAAWSAGMDAHNKALGLPTDAREVGSQAAQRIRALDGTTRGKER